MLTGERCWGIALVLAASRVPPFSRGAAAPFVMRGTRFDLEKAAKVLVDAITVGQDEQVAKRHGISTKTIQRYRERMLTDPELSRLVREHGREAAHTWHISRSRFLTNGIRKLEKLVEEATVSDIEAVTEAVRVIGELEIAREALGVSDGDRGEGPAAAEAAGSSPGDEQEDGQRPR